MLAAVVGVVALVVIVGTLAGKHYPYAVLLQQANGNTPCNRRKR